MKNYTQLVDKLINTILEENKVWNSWNNYENILNKDTKPKAKNTIKPRLCLRLIQIRQDEN
jgi:hypothetical protein